MPIPKSLLDVAKRYRFEIPRLYFDMLEQAAVRFKRLNVQPWPALRCCQFESSVEWLSPTEVKKWRPPPWWTDINLVAFATNGYGDYWCWCPHETDKQGTPVSLCRHDAEEATIYAANFEAFLFRAFLESTREIPHEFLIEYGDKAGYLEFLRENRLVLKQYLRPAWDRVLSKLLKNGSLKVRRRKGEEPTYSLMSAKELESLLDRRVLIGKVGRVIWRDEPESEPPSVVDTTIPEKFRVLKPLAIKWGGIELLAHVYQKLQETPLEERLELGRQVTPFLEELNEWLEPIDGRSFTKEMEMYSRLRICVTSFGGLLREE